MKILGIVFLVIGFIILGSVTTYLTLVEQAVQPGKTTAAQAANAATWTKQPVRWTRPTGAFANGTTPGMRQRAGGSASGPTAVNAPGYDPSRTASASGLGGPSAPGGSSTPAIYAGSGTPPSYPGSNTPPMYAGTGMPNTTNSLNAIAPPNGGRQSSTMGNTASSFSPGMSGGQSLSGVNSIQSTALIAPGAAASVLLTGQSGVADASTTAGSTTVAVPGGLSSTLNADRPPQAR